MTYRLAITLPDSLRKRLEVDAVTSNTSLSSVVRQLLCKKYGMKVDDVQKRPPVINVKPGYVRPAYSTPSLARVPVRGD